MYFFCFERNSIFNQIVNHTSLALRLVAQGVHKTQCHIVQWVVSADQRVI